MSISPKPLEVWLCHFRFLDVPEVKKVRPAVILEADEESLVVIAVKVTSHAPRNESGEFEVADLAHAGLLKQSTIRWVVLRIYAKIARSPAFLSAEERIVITSLLSFRRRV